MLSVILQATVLYWSPLSELFHTVPNPPNNLVPIVSMASVVLWTEELGKLLVRLFRAAQRKAEVN